MRKRCAAAAKKNQKIKNENVPKSTPRCTENERHLCAPVAFGPGRPRTPPPWTPTISTASCNKKGNGSAAKRRARWKKGAFAWRARKSAAILVDFLDQGVQRENPTASGNVRSTLGGGGAGDAARRPMEIQSAAILVRPAPRRKRGGGGGSAQRKTWRGKKTAQVNQRHTCEPGGGVDDGRQAALTDDTCSQNGHQERH